MNMIVGSMWELQTLPLLLPPLLFRLPFTSEFEYARERDVRIDASIECKCVKCANSEFPNSYGFYNEWMS